MAVSIKVIAVLFFGVVFINVVESDPKPQEGFVIAENNVMVDPNNPNLRIHKTRGPWVTRIHRVKIPIPGSAEGDASSSILGCFRDSLIKRLLPQKHDFPDNSPTRCKELCLQSGYQYAGVQNGKECWCGSEKPLREFKIKDLFCDMNCPNSPSEKCGGDLSMNVLSTGLKKDVPQSTMGCFRDSGKRLLPQVHFLDDNTPARCIDVCFQSGYQFAGVEYGRECWCGSQKPLHEFLINDDQCNSNCPKNPLLRCGGGWALNVFQTGMTRDLPHSTLGCFRDNDKRVLPEHHDLADNSPSRCIEICLETGHHYAGVEYGRECWCGDDKPRPEIMINDDQCNSNCPQSPLLKCGGGWALNIFNTGMPSGPAPNVLPIPRSSLGCVRDSGNRLLPQNHNLEDNSPSRCIDICLESGYQYAGVEYGKECWCGSQKPFPEFKINDDSCNMNCPKSQSEKCGGSWAMEVFYTGLPSGDPHSTLGCFRDSGKRLLPQNHNFEDNTPTRCIDVCLQSGHQYAGVEYGRECWCGNEKPLPQFKINDDQCNSNCPKNPLLKCGGGWALNVFNTK